MATILIVDDNRPNRRFLWTLLSPGGHRLLEAGDGAEALAQVRAERPDLVISDILMPTMDGYQFVRQLRSEPEIAGTAVIFFTATYHEREAQALAKSCGVLHLLSKPPDPDVILQAVDEALGLRPPAPPPPALDEFDREHLQLLMNKLAEKVSELEMANERLTALVDVGRQLALERDPLRLVESYCQAAREIIGARYAAVGLLAKDGEQFGHFFFSGLDPQTVAGIPAPSPRGGVLGKVLTERRPIRFAELRSAPGANVFCWPHPCHGAFLGVAIGSSRELYGVLYLIGKVGLPEFSEEHERMAVTLAAQVGVAYRSARQYEEIQQHARRLEQEIAQRQLAEEAVRASEKKLREYAERLQSLSRQLLAAQEAERRHMARELHDQVGQALTALKINLEGMRRSAADNARGTLTESIDIVSQTLHQVRTLSLDLRPAMLDDLGLVAAVRWYLDRQAQRAGFQATVNAGPLPLPLSGELATTCFRVLQEAVTNIVRHAQARQVHVDLTQTDTELKMVIGDDGIGFDAPAARERASRGASLGLLGMQERVMLLGGQFEVESVPNRGTVIRVQLPLATPIEPDEGKPGR